MIKFHSIEKYRKWWVLAIVTGALSMVFMDQTAVSIALPQIQKDLNASSTSLHWMINAYLVTLSIFIILGGKLGDALGQRRTFLAGLWIFTLASLACALAGAPSWIIISRALQGLGGALMIPSLGVLVINAFPEQERGRAIGIYVGIAACFLSIGPLLGGFVTEHLSWRWVFWINLPMALICLSLTIPIIPLIIHEQKPFKLDWLGFILQALGLFSFILALMQSAVIGWLSLETLALLAFAVLALCLFIWVESQALSPLVPLSLFKQPYFTSSILVLITMQSVFISTIFWGIFFQIAMGNSPTNAGLMLLPALLPMPLMAYVAGSIRDKHGARRPVLLGIILVIISTFWMAISAQWINYVYMLPGIILFGISAPLVVSNCMSTALSIAPPQYRGSASGIANAARQLGASLGVALVGSTLTSIYLTNIRKQLPLSVQKHHLKPEQLLALIQRKQTIQRYPKHFSPGLIKALHHSAQLAYTKGFSMGMLATMALAVLGLWAARKLPNTTLLNP